MAINTQRVLLGGLAAGVVLNIIDGAVNGFILKDRMRADGNAFKAGFGDQMAVVDPTAIFTYIGLDFVVGILLVWTYAAIRPRLGPGAKTAVNVAILFWVFGMILTTGYMMMGIMSRGLWFTYSLIWLVNLSLASLVGGWEYKEEALTAATAPRV